MVYNTVIMNAVKGDNELLMSSIFAVVLSGSWFLQKLSIISLAVCSGIFVQGIAAYGLGEKG
jgi:hypothetical protein